MARQELPRVSVVIPVRNEARFIGSCLRSLMRCGYPTSQWEIIVVDGGSRDTTRAEVLRVAQHAPVRITCLDNPRQITPFAMNIGLASARGEIIIRADAHAEYPDDYIARCVAVSQETGAENVGGPIQTQPGADTPMAHAISLALSHPFGVGNSKFRTCADDGCREVDTVPFGCFKASVFREVGLYDERLARHQDYDLNQRIRRAGGRILLDGRLRSTYFARPGLRGLLRQGWGTGFWNPFANKLNPHNFTLRHVIPGLFSLNVLATLAFVAWAVLAPLPRWALLLALASWGANTLYLLLDLFVSTKLARKHARRLWPLLLALFPAYHCCYGAGILWGLIRVSLRWYPWQSGDGVPAWTQSAKDEEQLAA